MWILKPLEPEGETHYLLPSKQLYVVGRKNCDIILPNDQSISRAHAQLTVTDETLTLMDSSKYGTFLNGKRLSASDPLNLKSGDKVTFGVFHSEFRLSCQKVVVSSSCLDNDGKASLSQALLPLGGKLVKSWTMDCTHLVMPSVKVTIKTISALLCCRPIVKQEFFTELNKALHGKLPPPKAESFIPEIDEPSLNKEGVDLGVMPVRKCLFAGKTFLFLSGKQLERLSSAVSFGGGKSQLLAEGSVPTALLESPKSCVIDVATGNSQALLPSTTTEWANSVRKILQQKGLRIIPESEIGLAAIYASCDKYCNPSNQTPNSESILHVNPRIASATLSQNAAVDETVLPTASQNITAYALNTEPTQQGMEIGEVTGVTAVGETPERKPHQSTSQLSQSRASAREMSSTSVVADTASSSLTTGEKAGLQRKKPQPKLQGGRNDDATSQPFSVKTNGGTRAYPPKQSPQKQNTSAQVSPQKQSTLTSFFQPVNRKRPLEDELSAVMSEPKRAAPTSDTLPVARAQSQQGTDSMSDRVSRPAQQEPHGRKRKEMEEEIQMEELESIMSEDMDFSDEQTSGSQGQLPAKQKKALNAEESSSTSKRKRADPEEDGKTNQKPRAGLEKDSASNRNQHLEVGKHSSSTKSQQLPPSENKSANQMSSNPPAAGSSASTTQQLQPFKDEEVSYIVEAEVLNIDLGQPKGEQDTPLKAATVKHEVSKMDEDLPKRLVLVEFKSLTVAAAPKTKPQQRQGNCSAKNFKCFRKTLVPGAEASPHIIRGSNLLAHNRGKNADLDEWLRDAAEEERQNKREERVGDDLFRYNPIKQTKRR